MCAQKGSEKLQKTLLSCLFFMHGVSPAESVPHFVLKMLSAAMTPERR
jgi:hypothetical protein